MTMNAAGIISYLREKKNEVKSLPYTIYQNQLQNDYRYNWGKQT